MAEMKSHRLDEVDIALLPNAFRMQGRKAPILTLGKEHVGGRTHRSGVSKSIAIMPEVKPVRVDADWKIQVQPRRFGKPTAGRSVSKSGNLFLCQPLNIKMIILRFLDIVASLDSTVSQPRFPIPPGNVSKFSRRPELRVELQFRPGVNEPFEFAAA